MAQTTTLILLPQTAYNVNTTTSAVGTAQKAAGYYLGNKNLQTIVWDFTSVNALMLIEASLAATPTNSDWFEVFRVDTGGISTQRDFQTIEGNFVWLRCRVPTLSSGVIQSVKVSY